MKTEVQTADTVMLIMGNGRIQERRAEKSLPRLEMNGLSEGYKRTVNQNWGRMAKIGFFGQNLDFGPKISVHFLILTMLWPRPEKVVQRKKLPFPNFGFFGLKTAVSP